MRIRVPRHALAASVGALAVSHESSKEKLPIYPQPEPPIIVLDEPSELERQIGSVRRQVVGAYSNAHAKVQGAVSRWIGVEHAVESRVKSLIDPSEEITPGLLYTTIATLSTSIVTRSRSLPVRFVLPPTAFLVSLSYFLPKTSANVSAYTTELEERYFPTLAEKHAIARAHSGMLVERIKDGYQSGREQMGAGLGKGVDWAQGVTGLKIREALGWSEDVLEGAEARARSVTSEVGKLLEHDKENLKGFAKEVADEAKARVEVGREKLEQMTETDKGLLSRWGRSAPSSSDPVVKSREFVGEVVDGTIDRAQATASEVSKMVETDKALVRDLGKSSSSTQRNPVEKAHDFVGDVVEGTVERARATAAEVSKMAETDRKLAGEAKEWVGDVVKETEARSKAASDELGKMLEKDKELAAKEEEEGKKEVKRLV
ncbi:hypothetical protein GLOTRDRAFT_138456 [Gloeophyllum trabeum ATCC 11539]|uniref:MICOS complex subunit n=1 Tax=Gloeophyllum trabeum (strain ATCC 11539 / FP-39264 / Madison 617) TaxID=670483 RepID=S7Q680_GLOTA|nr:uncharacterized protein GLOTRDRAFT_138456 [Gloeophyllum trabeum ATCC 11539]EPQ55566.1 hypothetical protein GLOTRDRAFT_138456 [Gloeophyllum trabeum ATCC 11539]